MQDSNSISIKLNYNNNYCRLTLDKIREITFSCLSDVEYRGIRIQDHLKCH